MKDRDIKTACTIIVLLFALSFVRAGDAERIERSLPIGAWEPIVVYFIAEDGKRSERIDPDIANKMCMHLGRDYFYIFRNGPPTPTESGALKYHRLANALEGSMEMEVKIIGSMKMLYRIRGDSLEICMTAGNPEKLPQHFDAKNTVVMVLGPAQRDRLISTASKPTRDSDPTSPPAVKK